jgi:hypothetical protein
MKNFDFQEAQQKEIYILTSKGEIEKTNLYDFVMSFAYETTSPQGVEPRLHIRQNEDDNTFEVWTWGVRGQNLREIGSGLTEEEAIDWIYSSVYCTDFEYSSKSTIYFESEEDAENDLAERFSEENNISIETAKHILRKEKIVSNIKQERNRLLREKIDNRPSFTREMMVEYILNNKEIIQEKMKELDTLKKAEEKDKWQVKTNALIQQVSNNDFRLLKWKEIYTLIRNICTDKVTYEVVPLKNGYFGIVKKLDNKTINLRQANWNENMANYELHFYLDGTLNMTDDDLYAKNHVN